MDKASVCVCTRTLARALICEYTCSNKPPRVILTGIKVEDDIFLPCERAK